MLKNEKQCYAALSIDQSTGSGIALFGTSSIAEDQFMAYGQYANNKRRGYGALFRSDNSISLQFWGPEDE